MNRIFKELQNGLEFLVYLTPGSQKESINDLIIEDNMATLKISVHGRPTDNQANESLIKFISNCFGIAKSNIIIKRGQKSRSKQIFINDFKISDLPNEIVMHLKDLISKNNNQLSLF